MLKETGDKLLVVLKMCTYKNGFKSSEGWDKMFANGEITGSYSNALYLF